MRRLMRSVTHAVRGISFTLKSERNFRVESLIATLALLFMLWLPLNRTEEALLIIIIVLVLAMELINTAVERVMDILKPRVHPYARVIKDVMAGAVFLVSFGAFLIGMLIFLPYLWRYII
ncbi:MAG: diacylglycerol kinase [Candidatus Moranbacteria bacterium]|jgi:diacylglycerol kinase|nr:diacylglycerol kinase [Candidatus Moranbacteria bacterium]